MYRLIDSSRLKIVHCYHCLGTKTVADHRPIANKMKRSRLIANGMTINGACRSGIAGILIRHQVSSFGMCHSQ